MLLATVCTVRFMIHIEAPTLLATAGDRYLAVVLVHATLKNRHANIRPGGIGGRFAIPTQGDARKHRSGSDVGFGTDRKQPGLGGKAGLPLPDSPTMKSISP